MNKNDMGIYYLEQADLIWRVNDAIKEGASLLTGNQVDGVFILQLY